MTRRYALCDDQWERIKDLLSGRAFPLLNHCRRTIGCSWKLCCTDIGQEFPAVTYWNDLATCFLVHIRTVPMVKELTSHFPNQSYAAISDKHPHCKFWVSLLAM